MLSHAYNLIIDRDIGAPGNGKDVVDGLNATNKGFFSMLTTAVKIPGADTNDSQMFMHNSTSNTEISLERLFNNISDPTHAHDLIDNGKDRKLSSKRKLTECKYHVH